MCRSLLLFFCYIVVVKNLKQWTNKQWEIDPKLNSFPFRPPYPSTTHLRSSTSSSILWLVSANTRILQAAHADRIEMMYGMSIVSPPSSYSHHTSIVPSFCLLWNRPMASSVAFGTLEPPCVEYTMASFFICWPMRFCSEAVDEAIVRIANLRNCWKPFTLSC